MVVLTYCCTEECVSRVNKVFKMSRVTTNPVFGVVSDNVQHKPGCIAIKDS